MKAELEARLRERLAASVYSKVAEFLSKGFGLPREKLAVIYAPRIAWGIVPDLVFVYDNT